MKRRDFLSGLVAALVAVPVALAAPASTPKPPKLSDDSVDRLIRQDLMRQIVTREDTRFLQALRLP